jgi:hypothetical protein
MIAAPATMTLSEHFPVDALSERYWTHLAKLLERGKFNGIL